MEETLKEILRLLQEINRKLDNPKGPDMEIKRDAMGREIKEEGVRIASIKRQ